MEGKAPCEVSDPDYDNLILAELRQIREELWGPFNGDLDAMSRYIR